MEERNYNKEERFDAKAIEGLKHHYTEILRLLGEDPAREGLQKTPRTGGQGNVVPDERL